MAPHGARPRYRPWTIATVAGVASLVLPTLALARLFTATRSLYPVTYAGVISSVAFLYFGYDKMQARNRQWRVHEMTLFGLALAGGWPGALLGMHYFQHKTRKMSFQAFFWGVVLA